MKLLNKTKMIFQESTMDKDGNIKSINLEPNKVVEVDEKLAKKWLKFNGIVEYVEPKEAKAVEYELKAEIEKLKAENAKLKTTKKTTKAKK